jgi:hypothetical protein
VRVSGGTPSRGRLLVIIFTNGISRATAREKDEESTEVDFFTIMMTMLIAYILWHLVQDGRKIFDFAYTLWGRVYGHDDEEISRARALDRWRHKRWRAEEAAGEAQADRAAAEARGTPAASPQATVTHFHVATQSQTTYTSVRGNATPRFLPLTEAHHGAWATGRH